MADGLVKVQVALGNIASKRERVKILYKKSKCFKGSDPGLSVQEVSGVSPLTIQDISLFKVVNWDVLFSLVAKPQAKVTG